MTAIARHDARGHDAGCSGSARTGEAGGRPWARRVLTAVTVAALSCLCGSASSAQETQAGGGETALSVADGRTGTTAAPATRSEAAELWVKAAEAYREGRYQEAVRHYSSLVEGGYGTSDVRYNLGNALLRSGDLSLAIAEYRRALVLDPRDQDARANLGFARRSTKDAVAPPAPPAWATTFFFWHYTLSHEETVKAAILVALVVWCLLAWNLLRPRARLSGWIVTGLALVWLALGLSAAIRWASPARTGVVIPAETDVYSGTDLRSRVIFNLHAGTEVRVTRSDREWTQFRLPDGQRGWLPTEQLEIVDPSRL